jgi:hypothetical protein
MEIVIGALIALGVWVVVGIAVECRRTVCTPYNEMARGYRLVCVDPEIGYKLVEDGTAMSFAHYSDEGALVEYLRLPVADYPLLAADLWELVGDGRAYRGFPEIRGLK